MLIAMAGLPGEGKSTIAEHLAVRRGVPAVSVDPVESAILFGGVTGQRPRLRRDTVRPVARLVDAAVALLRP